MVNPFDEVMSQPTGARFYRADLHIHSFGSSHDVGDASMTPTAIVFTAVREGLGIVAITDHNEINNVEHALNAAAQTSGVYVVPEWNYPLRRGTCFVICQLSTLCGVFTDNYR